MGPSTWGLGTGPREWRPDTNVSGDEGKGYLIARCRVDFRSQRLGFGLGGKEVLGLIQAEAQDLPI